MQSSPPRWRRKWRNGKDMSEAPERIWTCSHLGEYGRYYPEAVEAEGEHGGTAVEYIRADHVDALLKAEREKALREAAEVCPAAIKSYGMMKPGKPDQYASREAQIVAKGFARLIEQDILALIEKDATDG